MNQPTDEETYVASMPPEIRAHWAVLPDLWEVGRSYATAAAVLQPVGDVASIVVPPWKDLSLQQKVSFQNSIYANRIAFELGILAGMISILMDPA